MKTIFDISLLPFVKAAFDFLRNAVLCISVMYGTQFVFYDSNGDYPQSLWKGALVFYSVLVSLSLYALNAAAYSYKISRSRPFRHHPIKNIFAQIIYWATVFILMGFLFESYPKRSFSDVQ